MSLSIYRALISRSIHQLRSGALSATTALDVCISVLLVEHSSSVPSFTAEFSNMCVPLLTGPQAASLIVSARSSSAAAASCSSSCWWWQRPDAARHSTLLAAALRRAQVCRGSLCTRSLAICIRASVSSPGAAAFDKRSTFYGMLVDELGNRLEAPDAVARLLAVSQQEDSCAAVELARLLALSTVVPAKLIAAILVVFDELLPRLPAHVLAAVSQASRPWWSTNVLQVAATGFVGRLDLAVSQELAAAAENPNDSTLPPPCSSSASRLAQMIADAQQALLDGAETKEQSVARRRQLVAELVSVAAANQQPSSSTSDSQERRDAILFTRGLVLLTAWQKVLPFSATDSDGLEQELLRPLLSHHGTLAARLSLPHSLRGAFSIAVESLSSC